MFRQLTHKWKIPQNGPVVVFLCKQEYIQLQSSYVYLSLYFFFYLTIDLSIYLRFYLSIYFSISLSINFSIQLTRLIMLNCCCPYIFLCVSFHGKCPSINLFHYLISNMSLLFSFSCMCYNFRM